MAKEGLEERIQRLPCWQGRVALTPLKGGLTNISFVATDGTGKYVVRCGEDIPAHHVFRDRERAVSRAAFEAGLSPEVVHVEPGITVLRFIEGRTFGEADMRANIPAIVALLKTCHREVGRKLRGPANAFWVFHVIRDYVRLIDADAKYLALSDKLEHQQVPLPIVFGHHDLLPGNFMDDGRRLWLIDWEYGGFGTAMFDLANLSSNGSFAVTDDSALLDAYFDGKVSIELKAAFFAMKAASLLREALWAMVSDVHLKTPGVDYRAHAREYLKRLDHLLAAG
jgi:thiamine kinase-like enzyme